MKFKDIIFEWLLIENKEQIYTKYYSDINRNLFIRIIKADPKTIVNNNEIIQFGKYSRLLLELYKKDKLEVEDLPKATEYLNIVYNDNLSIDIKKINGIYDLYEIVKDRIPKIATTLEQILGVLDENEYSIVSNNDTWIIIEPKSEKAAAYIGVNTEWCTTWGKYCFNPNLKSRSNRYEHYRAMGPFYIIINKNNINDKYQLHFESDQLTVPSNREVGNRPEFFNQRPEVKKYFFPSLFGEPKDVNELKIEIKHARKYLSNDDVKVLMGILSKYYGGTENSLIDLLLNQSVDGLESLIFDENIKYLEIEDGKLVMFLRSIPKSINDYIDVHNAYTSMANSSYDDVYDSELESYKYSPDDVLGHYLESYYETRLGFLTDNFGNSVKSYEGFYNTFFDSIVDNDKIKESYLSEFASLTAPSLESKIKEELTRLSNHLDYSTGYSTKTLDIPIEKLIEYVSSKEIENIDDLESFIDDYCYYYDLPTDYSQIEFFDYDYESPPQEFMNDLFDDYFEEIIDEYEDEIKQDENYSNDCENSRKKFLDITKKYFDQNNTFENDFVKIQIPSNWFNSFSCNNGVAVNYENKKTNEKYDGYIQVDNLINHITMEPLFEAIVKKILKEVKRQAK